ncbi:MAG: efflux RND transporter permease subunit [Pseudomonadota bacterium]
MKNIGLLAALDRPALVSLLVLTVVVLATRLVVDFENKRLNVAVDASIESLLPSKGKALDTYRQVREKFVGDDFLVAVWVSDELFTPPVLAAFKRFTKALEKHADVDRVDSLATATYVSAEDDFTNIDDFLAELPESKADAESLRSKALANPLFAGHLVSTDGRAVLVAVHLTPGLNTAQLSQHVTDIREISREFAGDIQNFITGPVIARLETGETLFKDIRIVFPLAIIETVLISLIGQRSFYGVLLPLTVNLVSLLVTLALFVRAGHAFNFVTIIMPPVIFVVGFAYAVHIISDYQRLIGLGLEKSQAIKDAVSEVFVPLTLTAFTTAVGFSSLSISNIETIQVFGAFSAIGTILSWLFSILLVPIGLKLFANVKPQNQSVGTLVLLAPSIAKFDLQHRQQILFGSFVAAMLAVFFASRISVGTDYLNNFPKDAEIHQHFATVNEFFAGAVPIQVHIDSDIPDVFKNPDELRELDKLQHWLVQQPEIGGAVSFVDYMKMLHATFVPEVSSDNAIPATYNLSDQLLALGAGEDARQFIDARYKSTLMHVRSSAISTRELGELVARIEQQLEQLPAHLRGRVTGSSVILAQTMDEITRGQVLSLSGALLIIFIILAILFGSLKVGAIALIPNLLPIAIFFGLLGLTGITLNLATSLVATVALGIAVDDSIHYFSRFNSESRKLANEVEGVEKAIAGVIRPVTFTTAALCAGFLALLVSDLRNQVEFGLMAAITLFIAWFVDLVVSPALSSGLRFVTLWEVLAIDLGADPHKKIPLFAGLTNRQARIAALFGKIEAFAPGERILTFGEIGHEICIVVEGVVVAQVERAEGNRVLRAIHPGELFGEVALFTGTRTANIDAMTDVRVLRLNRESLERIQSRYPKIAAQIFWNLTGTVSERLADVTTRI